MNHKHKHMRKSNGFKKVVSIAVMGALCLTAAATVAAMTNPAEVIDVNLVENSDTDNNTTESVYLSDATEKTIKAQIIIILKNSITLI